MEDCSIDERLQQEMVCHRQWTDGCIERPLTLIRWNVVIIWLQCLFVDVVRHTGTLVPTQGSGQWPVGDLVEIFQNGHWSQSWIWPNRKMRRKWRHSIRHPW